MVYKREEVEGIVRVIVEAISMDAYAQRSGTGVRMNCAQKSEQVVPE